MRNSVIPHSELHTPHFPSDILLLSLTLPRGCATVPSVLRERLQSVRQRIRQACERSGRPPSSVTLVGVTKGVAVGTIQEAVAIGLTDLGENRVQEARQKQEALGSRLKAPGASLQPPASSLQPVRWHLIGHLQRNKAREAVELFHVIHSVDTLELIDTLEHQAAKLAQGSGLEARGKDTTASLEVFVQVNMSGEETKFGCLVTEALPLARAILQRPHLRLRGLMTLAPFSEKSEDARPHFRRLRQLRDDLAVALSLEPSALSLSMGMSQDFEVAIEEGADIVRVGTAIFGTRDMRQET